MEQWTEGQTDGPTKRGVVMLHATKNWFVRCIGGPALSVTLGASAVGSQRQMTAEQLSKLQEKLDAPNSQMKTIRQVGEPSFLT